LRRRPHRSSSWWGASGCHRRSTLPLSLRQPQRSRSSSSAAAAAAGAPSRRRVGNNDNSRRQGVRAGGDDVDARTASGEAVQQLLRRAAQRGRLLWLAGRVVVVVADRLCLMKRRRSVGRQLGHLASNFSCYVRRYSQTYTRGFGSSSFVLD
jgi:hypothetical protein